MQKNNREQAVNFSSAGDISRSLVFRQTFGRAMLYVRVRASARYTGTVMPR
jgi:hypothetical protein